jgi:hypothetical protein
MAKIEEMKMYKTKSIWIIIISNDYLINETEIYFIENMEILPGNCEN